MHMRNLWKRTLWSCDKFVLCHHQIVAATTTPTINARRYATPSYFNSIGKRPLVYRNLGQQLLRASERYGDRVAVISCHENGTALTYAEIHSQAERLAAALRAMGIQQGEHLAVWLPNSIQWYVTFLAAALGGYPLVCVNPSLKAAELEYALRKAKVRALVTMENSDKQPYKVILKEAMRAEDLQLHEIIMKATVGQPSALTLEDGYHDYDKLMSSPTRSQEVAYLRYKVHEICAESPCCIQFTSGTTGQPKAALLNHFNCVNMSYYMGRCLDLHAGDRRVCLNVPFFHAFGLAILTAALEYGSTLVMPNDRFDAVKSLQAIEQHKCNVIAGTPTMYVDLSENQRKLRHNISSLEIGVVGGASCTAEMLHQSKTILGLKEFRIGYGMTEATAITFNQNGREELGVAVSTVGKLLEHAEAKVVDEQGRTVRSGERGELCVRGFFNMLGYYEDEEKTREATLPGGWLRTGDMAILDAATGVAQIVGRKKDVIIRGGENVIPTEIEEFLESHDGVMEAHVIGVPDKRLGEDICVYIRLKSAGNALTEQDIRKYCDGRIAHYKVPRYVRFVTDFPKTTSGKIQKFKLLEMFKGEKTV